MESSKKSISARGKFILSRALAKLETDPPEVPALPSSEMCDPAVYHKTVGDTIVEEMRKRGYKVEAPPQWIADYEAHTAFVDRLKQPTVTQSEFEQSLKQARERLEAVKIDADEELTRSDEEWEDVDTSYGSNKSSSSKGATRNSNMLYAKKSLKQMMQDSAKKSSNHSSRLEQNKSMKLKKNTSATESMHASKSDGPARALKRQASSVVASDAKKDKKSSADKTEFARSQNSRVQLVKERKEIKERERSESIKAKIQQKQTAMKEKKAPKEAKTAQKPQVPSGKGAKAVVGDAAAPLTEAQNVKKSAGVKHAPETFLKPAVPVAAPSAGRILALESSLHADNKCFNSMQSKALEDRKHGGLAKQAMYQSILAAGEEHRAAINSTFLPGVDSKPDFDASLALKGTKDTFVVGSAPNATYISKPGLVLTPTKKDLKKETPAEFMDSFNETFRDYGIEDLRSDSDNTDDENAPTKRVPKWADMKTARFKDRVSRQRQLGTEITKYGLKNIYMPPSVDLEMIFEEENKRFDHHNTSSGIWNDTQDFIRH